MQLFNIPKSNKFQSSNLYFSFKQKLNDEPVQLF